MPARPLRQQQRESDDQDHLGQPARQLNVEWLEDEMRHEQNFKAITSAIFSGSKTNKKRGARGRREVNEEDVEQQKIVRDEEQRAW